MVKMLKIRRGVSFMKELVLGGGCFWGVEEYMSRIPGVVDTKVGYANGALKNPTYEEVCTGETGHVEACYVKYEENEISLSGLLDKFWEVIDPTLKDRQGNDIGSQYRTGIYYIDRGDFSIIKDSFNMVQKKYKKPILTEVEPLTSFYDAEEYHQDYLKKNPHGYCHIKLS